MTKQLSRRTQRKRKLKAQKEEAKAKRDPGKAAQDRKLQKRVTHGELMGTQLYLQNQFQSLEKQTKESIKQLWDNDSELQGGNRSAEFNLRAHQKVINALAAEVRHLYDVHNAAMKTLYDRLEVVDDERAYAGFGGRLIMHDVEVQSDDGQETTLVNRIHWPHYHEQVETDLEVIAAQEAEEKARIQERVGEIVNAIDRLRMECSADSLEELAARIEAGEKILKDSEGEEFDLSDEEREAVCQRFRLGVIEIGQAQPSEENDPEEVEQEAQKLLDQTKAVAEEVGKMVRGEEFNQAVIDEAQEVIDKDIAEHGDAPLRIPAKEEVQAEPGPPPKDDGFPDGADIFGG